MKPELLDREVLCIIDTRRIQKYLFHSNGDTDHYGASSIVANIMGDALEYAVRNIGEPYARDRYLVNIDYDANCIPFLTDKSVMMEVITNSAGNAMILFRTGRICQKVIRKVSRYYVDKTYCLDIAVSVVEKTDCFAGDLNALFDRLDLVKADFSSSHPLYPLPVAEIEKHTGAPGFCRDGNGEIVSKSTLLKRNEAGIMPHVKCISEIVTEEGPEGRRYVAIGHMDGNNMGALLSNVFRRSKITYGDGIKLRRTVDRNIRNGCKNLIEASMGALREKYFPCGVGDDEFERHFSVHAGGDDIDFACTPSLAMPFVRHFIENVRSVCIFRDGANETVMSVCAGIVYTEPNVSLITALDYADSCCAIAKKRGKSEENLIDGLCGNWVDFEIMRPGELQSFDARRSSFYVTGDGISLIQRPLTMEPSMSGTDHYLPKILERAKAIRSLNMPERYFRSFERSYAVGVPAYNGFVSMMEGKGYALREKLGKPLSSYGDGRRVANWFDATELSYFVPKEAD